MKTFPTNFAAEMAKKTGISPVWILKLTAGGKDFYLSDNRFQVASWNGGIETLPWVVSWGGVSEQMTGRINEIRVADMQIECLVDPDDSHNLALISLMPDLEKSSARLYLWFHGLDPSTDPPQELGTFYVRDADIPNETRVVLTLEDSTIRLTNIVGELVKVSSFPNADPDDVGKIFPLPFGTVKNVPSRATVAGLVTTLKADITSGATTCQVPRTDGIVASSTKFRIEDEIVLVTNVSGDTLTLTRAQNGTTAAAHSAGDRLLEYGVTDFKFVVSGHELSSIDRVVVLAGGVTEVDITDQCTKYTGATGNQLSGYGSRAVVTISEAQAAVIRNRVLKAATLSISDPGHDHPATNQTMLVPFDDISAPSGSWFISADYCIDGNLNSGGIAEVYTSYGDTVFSRLLPVTGPGAPVRYRFGIRHGGDSSYNNGVRYWYYGMASFANLATSSSKATHYSAWKTDVTTWAGLLSKQLKIAGGVSGRSRVWEVWMEVEYDPGTSSNSAGVTGSVNSVADAVIGGPVCADVTSVNTDPDDVIGDILDVWGGVSTLTVDGTIPATYKFNGIVDEPIPVVDLISRLAFQCRSIFRIAGDTARLVYRPDSITSEKTITACRSVGGQRVFSYRKADLDDVINTIDIRYDRDWRKSRAVESYKNVSSTTDADSITDYGKRERPELFLFDFVTGSTMADALRDFYLSEYKRRKWLFEFEEFLDLADLEFFDGVTLDFFYGVKAEILQVGFAPGSSQQMDLIRLVCRGEISMLFVDPPAAQSSIDTITLTQE